MLINEVFESFQGEGATIGTSSVFIRLHGCNLNCSWCDTPYTWKKGEVSESWRITPQGLCERIQTFHSSKNMILTGGEPLLQETAVTKFIKLMGNKYTYEIETNGTILPLYLYEYPEIRLNVSPKLSNSGVPAEKRYFPDILKYIQYYFPLAIFKFVITKKADIEEIEKEFVFLEKKRIYFMPEGNTAEEQRKKVDWVFKAALNSGVNFSPRVHTLIYDDKRGV